MRNSNKIHISIEYIFNPKTYCYTVLLSILVIVGCLCFHERCHFIIQHDSSEFLSICIVSHRAVKSFRMRKSQILWWNMDKQRENYPKHITTESFIDAVNSDALNSRWTEMTLFSQANRLWTWFKCLLCYQNSIASNDMRIIQWRINRFQSKICIITDFDSSHWCHRSVECSVQDQIDFKRWYCADDERIHTIFSVNMFCLWPLKACILVLNAWIHTIRISHWITVGVMWWHHSNFDGANSQSPQTNTQCK